MRRGVLFISIFLLSFINLSGTPEMRVEIFRDGASHRLVWEGGSGVSYTCFVETSANLLNWVYLPKVHHGMGVFDISGSVSSGEKLFYRIQYLSHPPGAVVDKDADDFDGDGVSNLDEVTMSQGDPLDAGSEDSDALPDDFERFHGLDAEAEATTDTGIKLEIH